MKLRALAFLFLIAEPMATQSCSICGKDQKVGNGNGVLVFDTDFARDLLAILAGDLNAVDFAAVTLYFAGNDKSCGNFEGALSIAGISEEACTFVQKELSTINSVCECQAIVNGGDGNDDRSWNVCFSGKNTVDVQDHGLKAMEDLQVGDYVGVKDGSYAAVYSFGHYDKTATADYLQISFAEDMEQALEVTPDHMVYIIKKDDGSSTVVPAGHVKVSDRLLSPQGRAREVSEIKIVKRTGLYAPYTETGDIVVSGVVASSYIAPAELPVPFPMQNWIQQALNAPRRMFCRANPGSCKNETYAMGGLSSWVAIQVKVTNWLLQQHSFFQLAFLYSLVPVLFIVLLVEKVTFSVTAMTLLLAGVAWTIKQKSKGRTSHTKKSV